MPSEHLATAENLGSQARSWLADGQLELARAYRDMAAFHLDLARSRHAIIGDVPPPPRPAQELPVWCGQCEGPDLGTRWVVVTGPDGSDTMRRCVDCNPYADSTELPRQPEHTPASEAHNSHAAVDGP
ncbi:hypothetical protein QQM39_09885 [Streptomyces sp. DT2A-34]|uniref:hypothetical protein n=1 Tax=Streptomyces sp. DT2A-34 TaxID=3051182 RepID=UPI00265B890C|nr:hypothetical protein [Streptomyces sp. DT2A-34]MDO0911152.1 hypothetical protein [Streptomyces sp. DT2A-34]